MLTLAARPNCSSAAASASRCWASRSRSASRRATQKLAETLVTDASGALRKALPPSARLARFSSVILVSDFLDPIDKVRETIEATWRGRRNGHLVQVLDPAEETLPYQGRTEFLVA